MHGRRKHQLASAHGSRVDDSSVSLQTIIRQARKSGQLNLSNRSFAEGYFVGVSLKHDGTVKMASLPVPSVSDRRDTQTGP